MLLKKKKITKYIIDDIEISFDSHEENSDEENSDEEHSDKENFNEKNLKNTNITINFFKYFFVYINKK